MNLVQISCTTKLIYVAESDDVAQSGVEGVEAPDLSSGLAPDRRRRSII